MTLQLNFDKTNSTKLLQHLEWLREIGLIDSFKIGGEAVSDEFEISDKAFEEIQKRRKDVKNGNFISIEKAKQQFK